MDRLRGAGATLADTLPTSSDACRACLARVFLLTKANLTVLRGGAGKSGPRHWPRFVDAIPKQPHDTLRLSQALFSGRLMLETKLPAWSSWEERACPLSIQRVGGKVLANMPRLCAVGKHYS